MSNLFDELTARMDALTASRFGKTVVIGGNEYVAVESCFFAEMGPLASNSTSLVVFSADYHPHKGDDVMLDGVNYTVTSHRRFNGKPQITLE
ncbi:DNA breaking-rejoining protein [Yersinia enterocolitica]|uniref:DNA breaking-rejoining protein n=1 Tax=Yersinia TaxID=629 RepID=UPI000B65CE74|nr:MULTISPECIES: DNA breaking-rejoining protein [Yersinia]MBW5814427.1 DNA breaking-rejoining protein [Yersinia kristensenii]MBW5818842.1 DNA breaking-rejoining protein [Yersinia kristensenii]MBW5831682.1 DNA breaking-rejoining protein [Yersinia kristensenii]MBW5844466.1 DNA breaking-rejoining protein [Yersinia kristensenii]OWF84559.1 hypothetical protein B4907_07425 [Yersinia kristensenii]